MGEEVYLPDSGMNFCGFVSKTKAMAVGLYFHRTFFPNTIRNSFVNSSQVDV